MARKRVAKAYLAPQQLHGMPSWNPNHFKSKAPVTCNGCGLGDLFWSWNFTAKAPCLIGEFNNVHQCPTPRHLKDIFPAGVLLAKRQIYHGLGNKLDSNSQKAMGCLILASRKTIFRTSLMLSASVATLQAFSGSQ